MSLLRETKRVAVGMTTHVLPAQVFDRRRARDAAGGSAGEDARYGYSIWLRHLVLGHEHGLGTAPRSVVELGPADSVGVGIAALVSGAQEYRALDVLHHDVADRAVRTLADIVELFRIRASIPDDEGLVDVHPRPVDTSFPHHVFPDERLEPAMRPERLRQIEAAIRGAVPDGGGSITFVPAWRQPVTVPEGSVDLILSQAVMEHVADLAGTYASMAAWLAPGGWISQSVDFRSHHLYGSWNGHLAVPAWRWRAMWGRREPLLNRSQPSQHARLMRDNGLEIVCEERLEDRSGLPRSELAREFRHLDDADLRVAVATFQARKPPRSAR